MLVVSSTDGFASVVAFDEGELGAPETNIPEHVKSLLASSRIGESVPDEVSRCCAERYPLRWPLDRGRTGTDENRASAHRADAHVELRTQFDASRFHSN